MRASNLLLALAALAAALACEDATTPPETRPAPTYVTLEAPPVDSVPADSALAFRARVFDQDRAPMADVLVSWTLSPATGRMDPGQVPTDSAGWAEAVWSVGSGEGTVTVEAAVTDAPDVAAARSVRVYVPRVATYLTTWHARELIAEPGDTVLLEAQVLDQDSAVMADVPVAWTFSRDSQQVASDTTVSASDGRVAHDWLLPEPGWYAARLTIEQGAALEFGVQVDEPPALDRFEVAFDTVQRWNVEDSVVFRIQALDQYGDGFPGATVDAIAGAGTLLDSAAVTDDAGYAHLAWRSPADPRDVELRFSHQDSLIVAVRVEARVEYLDLEGGTMPDATPFTVQPVQSDAIDFIEPLGGMSPPAHTLPTDHAYIFYPEHLRGDPSIPVRAPAAGSVIHDPQNGPAGDGADEQITIGVRSGFGYYLGHLEVVDSIGAGDLVEAGQVVGYHSGQSTSVDFGVLHADQWLPFINAERYRGGYAHADSPLRWFVQPLRDSLQAMARGSNPHGRLLYDVAGTAWGHWWRHDTPPDVGGPTAESYAVGFVEWLREVEPDSLDYVPVVSIGGLNGHDGIFRAPVPFDSITPDAGPVAFLLRPYYYNKQHVFDGHATGYLLAAVLPDEQVRLEIFADTMNAPTAFTDSAVLYVR